MKKKIIFCLIMVISIVFILASFAGCSYLTPESPNSDKTVKEIDVSKTPMLSANRIGEVVSTDSPVMTTCFKDDDFFYYFFDLGQIMNVPLGDFTNLIHFVNMGQSVTYSHERSTVKAESMSSLVSSTTQRSVNLSATKSIKIGAEVGKKDIFKVSAETAYSLSASYSSSNSITESYQKAETFSESEENKYSLTFNKDMSDGYYGYVLTGAVEVYALVVHDLKTNEYIVEYYNDLLRTWSEFYYFSDSKDFVNYKYQSIDFTLPDELPIPTMKVDNHTNQTYNPITVQMVRYNCNDGDHYDKNKQEESAEWRNKHDGYEVGELIIYGCKQVGNTFVMGDINQFSVKYHILQNTYDLPRNGCELCKIEDDSETNVRGTSIDSRVGHGAYWLRVTYSDSTQQEFKATNQFDNCTPNTYIEFINNTNINKEKNIFNIEVVVVYEIYAGAPGVFGIWWHQYTNWRCEYTFVFPN